MAANTWLTRFPSLPASFDQFPKLPKEIQDMIWSAALSNVMPLVEVAYSQRSGLFLPYGPSTALLSLCVQQHHPQVKPIFVRCERPTSVRRLSERIAAKAFGPTFTPMKIREPQPIYIHTETTILLLHEISFDQQRQWGVLGIDGDDFTSQEGSQQIKHVACYKSETLRKCYHQGTPSPDHRQSELTELAMKKTLLGLPRLETITILSNFSGEETTCMVGCNAHGDMLSKWLMHDCLDTGWIVYAKGRLAHNVKELREAVGLSAPEVVVKRLSRPHTAPNVAYDSS